MSNEIVEKLINLILLKLKKLRKSGKWLRIFSMKIYKLANNERS